MIHDMGRGMWRRSVWSGLLLLPLMTGLLFAQGEPITVTVTALPPYSPDLTLWESNPDKVLIRLTNRSSESHQVRLSGFAENLNGSVRIVTKDNYPRNRITVGPNATVNLNLRDLQLFSADAVEFIGAEKNTVARTKRLPEGSYRICVRALEFTTLVPLSPQEPSGCATFVIRLAEAPRPLLPSCGTTVKVLNPQLVNFQWSVPAGGPGNVQYLFEMAEVPRGVDPNDALLAKTSPILFTRRLNAPILSYGSAEPPLRLGQQYAWRVQAIDPAQSVVFRNEGYSEVCSFIFGETVPLIGGGDNIDIGIGINPIKLDTNKGRTFIVGDEGIRVRDLRTLNDLIVPACITLSPKIVESGVSRSAPQFQVEIQPGINPNAITGGKIEIWEEESKLTNIRLFDERKRRAAFEGTFNGHGASDIRHTKTGNSSLLDLMFINRKGSRLSFVPTTGKTYRWRVTLNFDGKEIRADGTLCNFNQAVSPFGKFPNKLGIPDRPDTLVAAGFEIVVEEWDASSKSEDASKPSGIGRIKFDCDAGPTIFTPIPWGPGDLKLKPYEFGVVDLIADSAKEFSLPEARTLDGSARVGSSLTVLMPDRSATVAKDEKITISGGRTEMMAAGALRNELLLDRDLLLDLFGKNSPDGIRVAFRDVKWNGPVQPKVTLTEGIAVYPSATPIPTPPARLDLQNGFSLDIDSLTIEPSEARVEGNILLPPSIISTDTCTYATLPVPETKITPYCEFYIESNDSTFGRWAIGETGLEIMGEGYVIDFSSTKSAGGVVPGLGNIWKGVVLRQGETPGTGVKVISNRGYVKGKYEFSNGLIEGDGFAGKLDLSELLSFITLDPYDYVLYLPEGSLELSASAIDSGEFKNGEIVLPKKGVSRSLAGGTVTTRFKKLFVQKDMDLFARVEVDDALVWGEKAKHPTDVHYYEFSARQDSGSFFLASRWQKKAFFPVADTLYKTPFLGVPETNLEAQGMGGVTFPMLRQRDFTIYTKDIPDSTGNIKFSEEIVAGAWMNVGAQGVHTELIIRPNKDKPGQLDVGPTWAEYYQADGVPFKILFGDIGGASLPPTLTHQTNPDKEGRGMRLQFVESAVWSSNLSGVALLEGPIGMPVIFEDMMFTSTANNAGGKVNFAGDDTLDYWGVEMVAKDTSKSAGIMAVKQGVIYLTAAGMAERVHFDEPFWLVWGEMEASGNFGRLFFDYNNVGQRFDDFGYSTEFVALSPFDPGNPSDSGYLQTYGSLSIPFFGAKMMSISDYRSVAPDTPYFGRFVRVLDSPHMGAGASDLHWQRSWAGGLADLVFDMLYDTVRQDGFVGPGDVSLLSISDGDMNAFLRMSSSSSCFRVIESSQHGFDIGPVASFGRIAEMWGCGCIEDGTLKQIALGGQLSHSATSTILQARTGDAVSLVFSYRPDRLTFYANGQMFINVGGSDVDVFGLTHFTFDWGEGYMEGYFKGTVSLGGVVGVPVVAGANAGISGFGEFSWHAGLDYQSIQGRVGVSMYNMVGGLGITVGGGTTLETGVYLGINAPKSKAWVMDGINGRFGLNKGGLPTNLTGFYAYLGISQGVDLFIVSGGYQMYVGVGAFAPSISDVPSGGVIGNFGIYVWGKILGGLVSAAAWGNLQMIAAIPPAFEGSLGLEACVLWVFCGSVSVHAGFNKDDGFYLY
ncbi:MAG: hypothetical protein H6616_04165 [Ignavibacteria bacterium]|nr:hypothetical protein [Ignavibacteria bacterium]